VDIQPSATGGRSKLIIALAGMVLGSFPPPKSNEWAHFRHLDCDLLSP
jgi:hypothetical protein